MTRQDRLLPGGKPRWIRCYDNGGKSFDRYTVIFTRLQGKTESRCFGIGMSEHPTHPQGFGQHFEFDHQIDRPRYSHLGKRITFDDLPEECQQVVMNDYKSLWEL